MIIQMIQMSVTSGQTPGHLTSSKILMLYTIGPFGAKIYKGKWWIYKGKSQFGPKSRAVANFEWIDLESEERNWLLVFCMIESIHKCSMKKIRGAPNDSGKVIHVFTIESSHVLHSSVWVATFSEIVTVWWWQNPTETTGWLGTRRSNYEVTYLG